MLFQNQPLGDLSERKIQLQGDFLIIPSHNSDPNSLSLSLLHPHPKIPFWPSWNPVTPRFLPSPPSHTTKVSNLVKPLLTTSQHILFLQLPKIAFFYPAFPYTYSRLPVRQEAGAQCAPPPFHALDHAHFSRWPTTRNSTSERNSPNTVTNAETVAQQRPRATINPTISTASPPQMKRRTTPHGWPALPSAHFFFSSVLPSVAGAFSTSLDAPAFSSSSQAHLMVSPSITTPFTAPRSCRALILSAQ